MPPRDSSGRPHDAAFGGESFRFGGYVLEKRIAVGGMSEVYLARPLEGGAPAPLLVIKRLLPAILEDPTSRGTFAIEARLHAAARHANVVEVYETGEVEGEPYLAMEYVSGVDAFRLMRRSQSETRPIPPGIGVYIAREICKALSCVHRLTDESGRSLGIIHRDVTPSNVYLSDGGDVKLGDFGIARSALRSSRPTASHVLKGKYAYLAPEQVSGEPFDHRADLFSLVVMLAEMLIGRALFPGAGQLAVLLAIRDCRIDPLRESAHLLPPGLLPILERGLAKSPDDRFSTADELYAALADFERPSRTELRLDLADLVAWAGDASVLAKRIEGVLRESSKMKAARAVSFDPPPDPVELAEPFESDIRTRDGRSIAKVPFAKLVEMIVTGELSADDEVDMMGHGFRRLEAIEILARHLPPSTGTTAQLEGPGIPDYAAVLPETPMLEVLAWLLSRRETGALFAEGGQRGARKELYFQHGKLVHVASSEPSELLGEYLVRQGALERSELEMALLALPRYEGRLGDTLVALGLVDPVQLFRAIRHQGRDRVAAISLWREGRVGFYRGVAPQHVQFPLDLDVPQLMLSGLELASPGDTLLAKWEHDLDHTFAPVRPPPDYAKAAAWPASVLSVVGTLGAGRSLVDTIGALATTRGMKAGDVLRALEVAIAGGIAVGPTASPARTAGSSSGPDR